MKRRIDEPQDSISSVYSQQHRLTESGGTLQRVLAPAPGHTPTGGLPPSQPFFDGAKSESMQSSVQYPMHSYQMTSGMSQSGHGPASVALHPAHNVQAQQVASQAAALSQTHAAQGQQQQFQRLKVEDALSYLDQVKFQFGSQPQVYNDFLDIMKEFKSQSIDTPGVISRVSTLFKGHPKLITGFNTFLPPGYKIEVQSNDQVNYSVPGSQTTTVVCTGTSVGSSGQTTGSSGGSGGAAAVVSTSVSDSGNGSGSVSGSANSGNTTAAAVAVNQNHGSTATQPFHNTLSTSPAPTMQVPLPPTTQTNQPVEFNHAITYVNKIKNRFQDHPDIYKQFLEILHTYQKEQRNLKEGINTGTKPLTEAEVYAQVATLFEEQNDLLEEFGQFLPDANGASAASLVSWEEGDVWSSLKIKKAPTKTMNNDHSTTVKKPTLSKTSNAIGTSIGSFSNNQAKQTTPLKRPPAAIGPGPPAKKPKQSIKDTSLAEPGKHGSLSEYAFFDKVRKALRNQEVYDNFLRCLVLFNDEVVSRTEVVQLVSPFLGKYPELFKWFKDFLGYKDVGPIVEAVPNRVANQERVTGDLAMEIGKLLKLNYSTCKRLGASYCALPKSYVQPKCSGRSQLCKEVLNDTWVSFPTWSEDSTFVSSRKTVYEEYIYRCEDERFELDVVLETNLATIRALEGVHKRLLRLNPEEAARLKLDDCLGGTSQVIHLRAIKRIYGDKALDIIDGLKKNPIVAVPLVLRRLKAKEEEWREAQKNYNKIWRDQNEKYYLKSLDHQGLNFKQNDVKALRSKTLLNEIEALYDEAEDNGGEIPSDPHMTFVYKDKSILDDAANLIIHHVKRQTSVSKDDKRKIKQLLRQFLPDLFFHPRQELSDDEKDDDNDNMEENCEIPSGSDFASSSSLQTSQKCLTKTNEKYDKRRQEISSSRDTCLANGDLSDCDKERENTVLNDNAYTYIFVNNHWYLFFRLHQILCERLTKMYERAFILAAEEAKDRKDRKESAAVSLRLKPKMLLFDGEIEIEDYYPAFLDMIKNLLDGNMESNTYEDTLREMFGIHAYIGFTMDKVVQNAVRQLQYLFSDEPCMQCLELFLEEQKNGTTGGSSLSAEQAYQKRVEQVLNEDNCFKICVYKSDCRMTMELLDTETDGSEDPADIERWSGYVENYVSGSDYYLSEELKEQLSKKPVFLPRNVRTWRQQVKRQHETDTNKKDKDDFKSKDDDTSSSNSPSEKKLENEVMDVLEGSQCRFNLNSFKMVFVVNSESYLYKRMALQKARESHEKVSRSLNDKFHKWHKVWLDKCVTFEAQKATNDWLMGVSEGLVPNKTRLSCDNDVHLPPYYAFNRYSVQWSDEAS